MTTLVFLLLCLLGGLGWMVITQSPQKAAAVLVNSGPFIVIGLGVLLTVLNRGFFGLPLIFLGLTWLRRNRPPKQFSPQGGKKSTVRSAHLEMELDHDTGDIDGIILTGVRQGARLSSLSEQDIIDLCREFSSDGDTKSLLETYLDRHHPDWREHANTESFSSTGEASNGQSMSRQEACQILGVAADASREEVLQAWRRLVKKVHPDSGGSAYLTAKLNAAKEVLLK